MKLSRRKKSSNPFSLFAFQDIITSVCGIVVLITLLLALELSVRALTADAESEGSDRRAYENMRADQEEFQKLTTRATEDLAQLLSDSGDYASLSVAQLRKQIENQQEENSNREQQKTDSEKRLEYAQARYAKSVREQNDPQELEAEKESIRGEIQDAEREKKEAQDCGAIYYSRSPNPSEKPWLADLAKEKITVTPLFGDPSAKRQVFDERDKVAAFLKWAKKRNARTEYFVFLIRPSSEEFFKDICNSIRAAGFRIGIEFIGEYRLVEVLEESEP